VLGCAAFLAACGVHLLGYRRFLSPSLRDPDPGRRRAGLVGWSRFAIAWQLAVVVLSAAWLVTVALGHRPRGYGWIAPPAGLVLGAALPLQLVVIAITRSAKRL
jgi:hypothetical protein